MPVSRRTKWLTAIAVGLGGAAVVASSIDQGSLARTFAPTRRPRGLPEGLAGDLEYLRKVVERHEWGATQSQRQAFDTVLERRRPLDIDQLSLAACEALACFDNAATVVLTTRAHRLGVRFGWVADALVVVKARPELANLLGHRVTSIAGGDPLVTWPFFERFVGGGTPAWLRNRSAWFFSVPEALSQVGLATADGVRLVTESPEGLTQISLLHAEAEPTPGGPLADFRDRFPDDEALGTTGWVSLLHQDATLPLYLQHTDELLFTASVPLPAGQEALYLRLLGTPESIDPPASRVEQVEQMVRESSPARFVVDVRYHSGGDYRVVLPLVRQVSERAREIGVPIKLLVGPNTIGGGLIAASQFLAHAGERTTVIGNHVGDKLRVRGQGRTFQLPRSGLLVQLCHDWHDLTGDTSLWHDVWLPDKFLLQGVGEFFPDQVVQNSWHDFVDGRDRVLEAALSP
ncbi:hypothetical protein [Aestuariimicrobium ganziense]|uniref:hypothetical protein n=1 Tax=Aestuariimicrobium ganziense TaxID=2773677 RepID=UPI001943C2C4|nr:hypothetical protein [Aestuariimicrobium ganziense]